MKKFNVLMVLVSILATQMSWASSCKDMETDVATQKASIEQQTNLDSFERASLLDMNKNAKLSVDITCGYVKVAEGPSYCQSYVSQIRKQQEDIQSQLDAKTINEDEAASLLDMQKNALESGKATCSVIEEHADAGGNGSERGE